MHLDETGFHACLFLLSFCILASNLLILVAIIKCEHLHIPSNIFVAGMALSDASVGVIGLPIRFVISLHLEIDFNSCLYLNVTYLFIVNISLYTLLAFTFERLYAICFPLRYYQKFNCKHATIAMSVVWVLVILLHYIPHFIPGSDHDQRQSYNGTCSYRAVVDPHYLVYVGFFSMYLGTLLIVLLVNSYIVCVMGRHKRRNALTQGKDWRKRDFKAEITLICMITVYIVCGLPTRINDTLYYFHNHPNHNHLNQNHVNHTVIRGLLILYFLKKFLNPIIYLVTNRNILRASINVIQCKPLNSKAAKTIRSIQSPSKRSDPIPVEESASSVIESKEPPKPPPSTLYYLISALWEMTPQLWGPNGKKDSRGSDESLESNSVQLARLSTSIY